jgi:hypothetical protein
MRLSGSAAWLAAALSVACACASACASAPPPPPPAAAAPAADEQDDDSALDDAPDAAAGAVASAAPSTSFDAPERYAPPSTKSYEEAMSTPEPIKIDDERIHLTDGQLNGPMRGVTYGCKVPSNAHLTIKTAVQFGRAIGVTVTVTYKRPKSYKAPKPGSKAAKAAAKRTAKLVTCIDTAVRAIVWPPSPRRDSFTTEF